MEARGGRQALSHRSDGVLRPSELSASLPSPERLAEGPVVVVECIERIPCNPCVGACAKGAITMQGDINEPPVVDFDRCDGCGICISACPGLAVFVVDASRPDGKATVMMPHEFVPLPAVGDTVTALDREGNAVCDAVVTRVLSAKALDRTPIVTLEVPAEHAMAVRHFRRRTASA
jgi:Fe-S-cluster-containing hydrogenase component 2